MDQLVSFELKDKYLLVVGHGKRDSLASMVEVAAMIQQKTKETNSRYMLVDYRRLEINVRIGEAFNIVKRYEASLPELREITIAAVFDTKGMEFGKYWSEVGRQRGFFIEIFEDIERAEGWLLGRMETGTL